MLNKTKMLILLPAIFTCLCATGCSEKYRAKKIFEDSSLTNRQKIDKLADLYFEVKSEASKHDKVVSDRAWDAICDGDYDKAVAILGDDSTAGVGDEALYYIYQLQEKLPAPNSFDIIVTQKPKKFVWDFDFSYPHVDSKPVGTYVPDVEFKIDMRVDHGHMYFYDPSGGTEQTMHWSKPFEFYNGYEGPEFKINISITAIPGSFIDYYTTSDAYKYEITFDVNNLVPGTFSARRIN